MGQNQSNIQYLEFNKPIKIIFQSYPYFHNMRNQDLTDDLGYLLLKKLQLFKEYLFEIFARTSNVMKKRCMLNEDNIFLSVEKDFNAHEYIIVEIVMKIYDNNPKEVNNNWYDIFFEREEEKMMTEVLKQSIILAIHEFKKSLIVGENIFFRFQENDMIDFQIIQ